MTKNSWTARLTPFTGGAALALMILGLVVHSAEASTPACLACQSYWTANATKAGQPCFGLTGQAAAFCTNSLVYEKCVRPHPPADSICLGPATNPGYTDCASETCSTMIPCGIGESTTSCTGFCAGCDSAGNSCNLLLIIPPPIEIKLSPCYNYCGCGSTP